MGYIRVSKRAINHPVFKGLQSTGYLPVILSIVFTSIYLDTMCWECKDKLGRSSQEGETRTWVLSFLAMGE